MFNIGKKLVIGSMAASMMMVASVSFAAGGRATEVKEKTPGIGSGLGSLKTEGPTVNSRGAGRTTGQELVTKGAAKEVKAGTNVSGRPEELLVTQLKSPSQIQKAQSLANESFGPMNTVTNTGETADLALLIVMGESTRAEAILAMTESQSQITMGLVAQASLISRVSSKHIQALKPLLSQAGKERAIANMTALLKDLSLVTYGKMSQDQALQRQRDRTNNPSLTWEQLADCAA